MYRSGTTSILVNGVKGKEFQLGRGVRQGCPLAPYLYLFIADVLGHMIADPT
jgi:hypothetical protein